MSGPNHINQHAGNSSDISRLTSSLSEQPQGQDAEKHIVYFDSYDASPPSYDAAQQEDSPYLPHSSDADFFMEPRDIPLNHCENTCVEPEARPLMMAESLQNGCIPSAPSLDQMQANTSESMDTKTPNKKRKMTPVRIFLACCVWFAGITFMSVSLFGYECFDECESNQDCDRCFGGIRKGGLSLLYTIFILACIFATWKAVRFTLTV
ncbi:hypothetical protein BD408DRAFT_412019 [Parasitella parasitica]|nr:hypothetical protein BD408DRAFT_412019 [Parasitella parasitica]